MTTTTTATISDLFSHPEADENLALLRAFVTRSRAQDRDDVLKALDSLAADYDWAVDQEWHLRRKWLDTAFAASEVCWGFLTKSRWEVKYAKSGGMLPHCGRKGAYDQYQALCAIDSLRLPPHRLFDSTEHLDEDARKARDQALLIYRAGDSNYLVHRDQPRLCAFMPAEAVRFSAPLAASQTGPYTSADLAGLAALASLRVPRLPACVRLPACDTRMCLPSEAGACEIE
jgi:hypothetical protein